MTMAALALLLTQRPRPGFAVLGLAIAVKGYPAVVAVVAAAVAVEARRQADLSSSMLAIRLRSSARS